MNESLFVSGTDVRNYMLNDSLVDWLKLYSSNTKPNDVFIDHLLNQGKEFETKIIKNINDTLKIVSVSSIWSEDGVDKTLSFMKQGIPLIHSAPIKSDKLKLKGVADLLIRNDYLKHFTDFEYKHSCSKPYHYLVLDVKWSTIKLTANQFNMVNSANTPAYKGQIRIYNLCISEMQDYEPTVGFILGRRYSCDSKNLKFNSPFDKLGIIDYDGKDFFYKDRVDKAINWVREVRTKGKNWVLNPPSNYNLYPNMKVDSGCWNSVKTEIAKEIGEITLLWYCGIKNRQYAFDKGIFSYKDKRCSSLLLRQQGKPLVDKILKINQQAIHRVSMNKNLIIPVYENEMFVDFETFCDVIDNIEDYRANTIFLIGVHYKGNYYSFVAKDLSEESELEIMEEFVSFVVSNGNPVLWYWHAEAGLWDRSCEHQISPKVLDMPDLYWKDLKDVFMVNNIVIKDCFSYRLKDVASALCNHNLISVSNHSEFKNGKEASLSALFVYLEKRDRNELGIRNSSIIKEIIKYNEFDVVVLNKLLFYVRSLIN